MITQDLSSVLSKEGLTGHAELRMQQNTSRRVMFVNGDLRGNQQGTVSGFSARVMRGGVYGFASGPADTETDMRRILREAAGNADFLNGKVNLGRPDFPPVEGVTLEHGLEFDRPLKQKTLIDTARLLDEYIVEKYPKLTSRTVGFRVLNMEKLLLTGDGTLAHTLVPRTNFNINMTMDGNDGTPVSHYEIGGGYGHFDDMFVSEAQLDELKSLIDKCYQEVAAKAEGIHAEAGMKTVILAPEIAGLIAHEAVGHTVEADFVQSGSVGGPCWHKQVASEMVTLIDYAHHCDGELCPVPVFVDDEGVAAEDAVLIENGKLIGYMHNRESAQKYGHKPQGNARAMSFYDEPLIRMRNTAIVPGSDTLDEMIASIDDGYYFTTGGNGQADATGEFMFGCEAGREIKNGKLGRPLKPTTISGVAFEVLKTVDMLSNDMCWTNAGYCGKKQMIPVGMGGPAIRIRLNVGGR